MESNVSALGPQRMIEVYDLPGDAEDGVSRDGTKDDADHLRLIQESIRMSADVVAEDRTQLAGQLLGRLPTAGIPKAQAMLEQARHWAGTLWLRPLTASLMPPGGPLLRTLRGHMSQINAVAVTPDGRRVVSASDDLYLGVWDIDTGDVQSIRTGHTGPVVAVAVTPDGERAVSGSNDHTLKVWDLESGECLFTMEGHLKGVRDVAVTPYSGKVVSASDDQTLKVWDVAGGMETLTLTGHTGQVWEVAALPDGKRALSAAEDHTLKLWDLQTGAELLGPRGWSLGSRGNA